MRTRLQPDDPREWLNRAHASLARARLLVPGGYIEDACTDARQAGEKALKGLLLRVSGGFPRTHSLVALLDLIVAESILVPDGVLRAGRLTRYATARYPSSAEPVTVEEHRELLTIAADVVDWVAGLLNGPLVGED